MGFSPKSWLQRGRGEGPKRPEPAFRVQLAVDTVESSPAVLSELSRGIVAIRTPRPPRVGTRQELAIRIGDAAEVALCGLVVWSKPARAGANAGFGAKLEDASPAVLAALVELAEQVRTRAAPAPAPRAAALAAPVTEILRELPPPTSMRFPEPESALPTTLPPIREQPLETGAPTPVSPHRRPPPPPPEQLLVTTPRVPAATRDELEPLRLPADDEATTDRRRARRTPRDETLATTEVSGTPPVRTTVERPSQSAGEIIGKFRIRPGNREFASGVEETSARNRVDADTFTSADEVAKAAWALAKFDTDVIELSDEDALLQAPPVREQSELDEAEAVLAFDYADIEIDSMLAAIEREGEEEIVVEYGPAGIVGTRVFADAVLESEVNLELEISPDLLLPEPDVRALGARIPNELAALFEELGQELLGTPVRHASYGFHPDEAPFDIDDSSFTDEPETPETAADSAHTALAAGASASHLTEAAWADEPESPDLALTVEGLDATATALESTLHFQSEHDLALHADLGMLLGELPGASVNPALPATRPIALLQPAGGPTLARLRFETPRLFLAYYQRYLRAGMIYVPTRVPPRPGTPVDVTIKLPDGRAPLRGKAMAVIRPPGAPLNGCLLRLVDDGRLARKLQRVATELA